MTAILVFLLGVDDFRVRDAAEMILTASRAVLPLHGDTPEKTVRLGRIHVARAVAEWRGCLATVDSWGQAPCLDAMWYGFNGYQYYTYGKHLGDYLVVPVYGLVQGADSPYVGDSGWQPDSRWRKACRHYFAWALYTGGDPAATRRVFERLRENDARAQGVIAPTTVPRGVP